MESLGSKVLLNEMVVGGSNSEQGLDGRPLNVDGLALGELVRQDDDFAAVPHSLLDVGGQLGQGLRHGTLLARLVVQGEGLGLEAVLSAPDCLQLALLEDG